jgi:NADH-quinone oxidoreductase subunit J
MVALSLFYFLSFVSVLCALLMIFSKNPVHSVLYLVLTFFSIAGHYYLLNAKFLAVVHVIVYAGAIMVLFLYVIMMLNLNEEIEPSKSKLQKIIGTIAGSMLILVMVASLKDAEIMTLKNPDSEIGLIENLGKVLFNDFMLPFELASVLLLSAMVGAIFLSKKELTEK